MENNKIDVLRVEPLKNPELISIENSVEDFQREVEGYFEITYPFEDPVAILCNEEGKIENLPLNRAIYDGNNINDIIAGNMLIVGLAEENFRSLEPEEIEKYKAMFWEPEIFYMRNGKIQSRKMHVEEEMDV